MKVKTTDFFYLLCESRRGNTETNPDRTCTLQAARTVGALDLKGVSFGC